MRKRNPATKERKGGRPVRLGRERKKAQKERLISLNDSGSLCLFCS